MKYYLECTHTYHTLLNSGIQRVVRNVVRSAKNAGVAGEIIPVVFENGKFFPIDGDIPYPMRPEEKASPAAESIPRDTLLVTLKQKTKTFLKKAYRKTTYLLSALVPIPAFVRYLNAPRFQPGLTRTLLQLAAPFRRRVPPNPDTPPAAPESIVASAGDVLVLLDSSWHLDIWEAVDECKSQGAKVVVVLYDLIPIYHPQFCDDHLVRVFRQWFDESVSRLDCVIGISETSARSFRDVYPQLAGSGGLSAVTYFWLGSELDGASRADSCLRPAIAKAFDGQRPTYIYVSTIEPRKNHAYALDAFDRLWQQGGEANFVIIGRRGWKIDDFIKRVQTHAQFNNMLFMFNDVEDDELGFIYNHARGLIFTSLTEGFGLPIVEGLQRGLPVFASDIPVFREIGKQGVQFVDLDNPQSLADALQAHLQSGAPRLPAPVQWLSWQQSTQQFFERITQCLEQPAAKPAAING